MCWARTVGELFDGAPTTYEMFGPTPLEAAREYATRKWNSRSADEFEETVNRPAREYVEPTGPPKIVL